MSWKSITYGVLTGIAVGYAVEMNRTQDLFVCIVFPIPYLSFRTFQHRHDILTLFQNISNSASQNH